MNSVNFVPSVFRTVCFATVFVSLNSDAQVLSIRTITQMGGTGAQSALTTITTAATNQYFIGSFETTATIGTTTLTNTADFPKIFVAKLNSSGVSGVPPAPLWAVAPTIDSPVSNSRLGVPSSGGAIIAGSFAGTNISFGGFSITNSSPGSSSDVFLGRYNTSGTAQWVVRFGGSAIDECGDLVVDANGNSFLAGTFQSSVFAAGATNLTKQSTNGSDCFFIKCSSSGAVTWARQGNDASAKNIALDQFGNIYLAGIGLGTSVFDGFTPTNPTTGEFFVKYANTGLPVWSRGDMQIGSDMAVDRAQNIISAGTFSGVIQFGSITLSNDAPATVFVVKYDLNGEPLWAGQLPGLGHDEVTSVFVDSRTNYWITGSFATNDNGSRANPKMFFAGFNSAGNLLAAHHDSGSGTSTGTGLGNVLGGVFITGTFSTNLSFLGQTLTNNTPSEIALLSMYPIPPSMAAALTGSNVVYTWPNPTSIGFLPSDVFSLEASSDLSAWSTSSVTPTLIGSQYVLTNSITNGAQFFRLQR